MLKSVAFGLNSLTFILVLYACKSDNWRVTTYATANTQSSTETHEGIWWWCNHNSKLTRSCRKQPYNFNQDHGNNNINVLSQNEYEAPRFVMYQVLTIAAIAFTFLNVIISFVALECTTVSVLKSGKSRNSGIISFITAILITIPTVYFSIADIFNYETIGKSHFGLALWTMYFSIIIQVTAAVCSFMGRGSEEEDYEIGQTFVSSNQKHDYTGGNAGNTYI